MRFGSMFFLTHQKERHWYTCVEAYCSPALRTVFYEADWLNRISFLQKFMRSKFFECSKKENRPSNLLRFNGRLRVEIVGFEPATPCLQSMMFSPFLFVLETCNQLIFSRIRFSFLMIYSYFRNMHIYFVPYKQI